MKRTNIVALISVLFAFPAISAESRRELIHSHVYFGIESYTPVAKTHPAIFAFGAAGDLRQIVASVLQTECERSVGGDMAPIPIEINLEDRNGVLAGTWNYDYGNTGPYGRNTRFSITAQHAIATGQVEIKVSATGPGNAVLGTSLIDYVLPFKDGQELILPDTQVRSLHGGSIIEDNGGIHESPCPNTTVIMFVGGTPN